MWCGGEEECIERYGGKATRKQTTRRPRHRWRIITKWSLEKEDGVAHTGLIELRIGTNGWFL
jgi:hypothetical protein